MERNKQVINEVYKGCGGGCTTMIFCGVADTSEAVKAVVTSMWPLMCNIAVPIHLASYLQGYPTAS